MSKKKMIATAFCVVLGLPAAAAAENPAPYAQPDDTWISISGTIASPTADSFYLDYGDGTITVEMDDWDRFGDAHGLMDGDKVTVYGEIDDGLYEATTIEASSVYVQNLNTYFHADSADEEGDISLLWNVPVPVIETAATNVRGTVSSVDPTTRTFTLDTGNQMLTVDTWGLGYNPLDEYGYQRIQTGDVVSVTGTIDADFFEGRELEAESVITLSQSGTQ